MSYKDATTTFVPPVKRKATRVWTDSDVKALYHKFLTLPTADDEWSSEDDALNEEVMDGVESLIKSKGKTKAKSAMKLAGATKEHLSQLFG